MRRVALWQTLTFLALLVAVAGFGWQVRENRRLAQENRRLVEKIAVLAREGRDAHDGLCALKADLARRIDEGHAFLDEHPSGIPGIPRKTIETSIANQEATLRALRVVTACPKPTNGGHP